MKNRLERKYLSRKDDLIKIVRKENFAKDELIKKFIPQTQTFIKWCLINHSDIVMNYLYKEFKREILLYLQNNHKDLLDKYLNSLPELPIECCHCGELPIVDNITKCLTPSCVFEDMEFEDVEEWNKKMGQFR